MPSWTPKFEIISVEPFIENVRAVVLRDAVAALAWASPDPALRNFQAVNLARQASQQWPVLNLLPFGNDPEQDEDGAKVAESPRVLVEVETVDRVANNLVRYLTRYVLAVRSMLYEMSDGDLTTLAVTIPKGRRAGLTWDVSTERYGERFYEGENLYTQVGSVVLTINYTQGKKNG